MSTQNRRSSFSSSTASSLAKRSSENMGKITAPQAPHLAKKRAPLSNLTNHRTGPRNSGKGFSSSVTMELCTAKITKAKNGSSATTCTITRVSADKLVPSSTVVLPQTNVFPPKNSVPLSDTTAHPVPSTLHVSPTRSDCRSVSMDESMSTCDSFNSPDVEYIDNNDVSSFDSMDRKKFVNLSISEGLGLAENIVDVDDDISDPQRCPLFSRDIYEHLRESEAKKRPAPDFMDRVQKDINSSMRAILIDWLVEVSEEYRLVPDTLYLTVNYIDRYLSGNVMNRQRLQLLGVACMMIAAKYEEICAPQVEEFCYITDNTYFKEEVLQMETAVLGYLKFEMTAATPKCFLRRFVHAAQRSSEVPPMHLECMANYISELSLLEYSMLPYAPSLIAASSIFLAKYIMFPSQRPWNSTLVHYTKYQACDLHDCVKALHQLCYNSPDSNLPAIREKYSQHKYKAVSKKPCPSSIPEEYFYNASN